LKIVVVGLGYVGVPLAALLADVEGFQVTCLQRPSERSGWKIDSINRGLSPIGGVEPGLGELVDSVVKVGRLRASSSPEVVRCADCVIIAVQTPVDEKHVPVLTHLEQAVRDIGENMSEGALISVESTVPPGTTSNVVQPMLEETSGFKAGADFNLVYSYERVTPGRLLYNIRYLPRVVGGVIEECVRRGIQLYSNVCEAPICGTDVLTAETAKLVENAYRDVNIAFANEAAKVCQSLGVDFYEVRSLVNSLPYEPGSPSNPFRDLHIPGAGVGGHCLPKDPWLLIYGVQRWGSFKVDSWVMSVIRTINNSAPNHMRMMVLDALAEKGLQGDALKVTVMGLAYKEDTDDPRNSPGLEVARLLTGDGLNVVAHDPYVKDCPRVTFTQDLDEAVRDSDCLVLATRHSVYREHDLDYYLSLMRNAVIVDGRNMFSPDECRAKGVTYRGVGRPFKPYIL
jgi:UDP-N-acetyl-D-mannosaminuronic acid dehydrogenase